MGTIVYHAVIRARRPPGAVLQVRWGEASPSGIQDLCNALVIAAQNQLLEVEITLSGDGKEGVEPGLQHRFARLQDEGISVRCGWARHQGDNTMRERLLLTAEEKQTAMIGAWLSFRSFVGVDFSDTLFETARCDNAEFVDVDLCRSDFLGANLTNTIFRRCNLSGCQFADARLAGTRFVACSGLAPAMIPDLRGRGASVCEGRALSPEPASGNGGTLDLSRREFGTNGPTPIRPPWTRVLTRLEKQTRMVGASLTSQRFTRVDFSDTVFAKANCANAVFLNVDLRGADFSGALLTNVLFVGCEFGNTGFTGATVAQARFIACMGLDEEAVRFLSQGGAKLSCGAAPDGERRVSRG